jgi:hypothetical protein
MSGNALIGRYAKVYVGANVVANLSSWKLDFATDELDASVFGTGWGATMPGQQKWTATVDGFLDMTDTTGQVVIKAAKFAGTKITNWKFLQDSTSGWVPDITTDATAGGYVTTMSIDAANNGLVKVSFKVGGVGPIAFV